MGEGGKKNEHLNRNVRVKWVEWETTLKSGNFFFYRHGNWREKERLKKPDTYRYSKQKRLTDAKREKRWGILQSAIVFQFGEFATKGGEREVLHL